MPYIHHLSIIITQNSVNSVIALKIGSLIHQPFPSATLFLLGNELLDNHWKKGMPPQTQILLPMLHKKVIA